MRKFKIICYKTCVALIVIFPILVGCSTFKDNYNCLLQAERNFGTYDSPQKAQFTDNCKRLQFARRTQSEQQQLAQEQKENALQPLIVAAKAGNAEAQYQVGLVYSRYNETQTALQYFNLSASQKYGLAEFQIGKSLEQSNNDVNEVISWYDRAFSHGVAEAGTRSNYLREKQRMELDAQEEATKQALEAARQAEIEARKKTIEAAKNAKAAKILDEIITKDSAGWVSDIYESGSLHDVEVVSQSDSDKIVKGYFRYIKSYENNGNPWVLIKFHDYKVACVTYWNFPSECRSVHEQSNKR